MNQSMLLDYKTTQCFYTPYCHGHNLEILQGNIIFFSCHRKQSLSSKNTDVASHDNLLELIFSIGYSCGLVCVIVSSLCPYVQRSWLIIRDTILYSYRMYGARHDTTSCSHILYGARRNKDVFVHDILHVLLSLFLFYTDSYLRRNLQCRIFYLLK